MLQNASYLGYIDLDIPRFGDIVVLAHGKLKQNNNGSFFFEQVNETCDHQCQQNANQYLKDVTALWMVERIRHRDPELGHRFDLKFTIVPVIDNDELEDNLLGNRLNNQQRKTFILRDFDYPKYFYSPTANRKTDFFKPHFEKRLSDFVSYNPSTIFPSMNVIAPSISSFQNISKSPRKSILNLGEYFMQPSIIPKYQNAKNFYLPSVNTHSSTYNINGRIKFPDSREGSVKNSPRVPSNLHYYNHFIKSNLSGNPTTFLETPELKQEQVINKNLIDHRGAVEHVFKKKNMIYNQYFVKPTTFLQSSYQHQHQPNINNLPLQSIRTSNPFQTQNIQQHVEGKQFLIHQMPFVQTPYALPPQIQQTTPNNQLLFQKPNQSTFRYQMQPILDYSIIPAFHYLPKVAQYQQIQSIVRFDDSSVNHRNTSSENFQQSEKLENKYYSPPDPIYFPSTTEIYDTVTTYSSNPSKLIFLIKPQIESPVGTASIRKVNIHNENGFQLMDPPIKLSGIKQLQSNVENNNEILVTEVSNKPNSINSQLPELGASEKITIPYLSTDEPKKVLQLLKIDGMKKKVNDTENYDIILKRPTFHQKTTEKPILKWILKKNRGKTTKSSPNSKSRSSLFPTPVPPEKITTLNVLQKQSFSKVTRGRNRYNFKRTSTTSPTPLQTLNVSKKKFRMTTSLTTETNTHVPFEFSTVFPTYILTESTDKPFTLESFSTSISLVVGTSTTTDISKSYKMVQAVVEPLVTNLTNIKLYRASVNNVYNKFAKTQDFDNLTFSILNHARAIETVENDENS